MKRRHPEELESLSSIPDANQRPRLEQDLPRDLGESVSGAVSEITSAEYSGDFSEKMPVDLEYGKKTWTTGQTVRDFLQNHLDAQTEVTVERIRKEIVRPRCQIEALFFLIVIKKIKALKPHNRKATMDQLSLLCERNEYWLRKNFMSMTPEQKLEKLSELARQKQPELLYQIIDQENPDQAPAWITREQLGSKDYRQRIKGTQRDRFQINGVRISDQGSGFDPKLATYFMPTKEQSYLRGKYGEGLKMSVLHAVRNGARVSLCSTQKINKKKLGPLRSWEGSFDQADNHLCLTGKSRVELPKRGQQQTGSITQIDLSSANPNFKKEFADGIDPRRQLEENCLDFSGANFEYPVLSPFMGVNPRAGYSSNNYVQGLKVEGSPRGMALKYDFTDANVLAGRDRNQFDVSYVTDIVDEFWKNNLDPRCLRKLLKAVLEQWGTLEQKIGERLLYSCWQNPRQREILLEQLVQLLKLNRNMTNLLVSRQTIDQYTTLKEKAQGEGFNICILERKDMPEMVKDVLLTQKDYVIVTEREYISSRGLKSSGDLEAAKVSGEGEKIFRQALEYANHCLEMGGYGAINNISIRFAKNQNRPFEFTYLVGGINLICDPAFLKNYGKSERNRMWQSLSVEILSAVVDNGEDMALGKLKNTQQLANNILNRAAGRHSGKPNSTLFHHDIDGITCKRVEYVQDFESRRQQNDIKCQISTIIHDTRTTPGDMGKILDQYKDLILNDEYLLLEIQRGIYASDDSVAVVLVIENEGRRELKLIEEKRSKLKGRECEGRTIYSIGNHLFTPMELTEDTVIGLPMIYTEPRIVHRDNQYWYDDGKVIHISGISLKELVFGKGIIGQYRPKENKGGRKTGGITTFSRLIAGMTFEKTNVSENYIDKIPQTLRTGIDISYGEDRWDEPVRVFQDIVQNHLDAGENGKFELFFEVMNGGQSSWKTAEQVEEEDTITGFRVSDEGEGYSPKHLETLGKTGKHGLFTAGKYGEGLKMLAAAAVRNGMKIEFCSITDTASGRTGWRAEGTSKQEQFLHKGDIKKGQRLCFNVSRRDGQNEWTSSTTIRLPDSPSIEQKSLWNEWLQIIHPLSGQEGYRGLARYILPLREDRTGIIDLGFIKILLDEPGVIYENGLHVGKTYESYVCGYDVPEVCNTRERNSVDKARLDSYIQLALNLCDDPDYFQALAQSVMDQVNDYRHLDGGDLDYSHLDANKPESLRAFYHLREALRGEPRISCERFNNITDLYERRSSLELKFGTDVSEEETKAAQHVLPIYKDHFSERSVPEETYRRFHKVLDTPLDWAFIMTKKEVETSEETQTALTQKMREKIEIIKTMIQNGEFEDITWRNSFGHGSEDRKLHFLARCEQVQSIYVCSKEAPFFGLASGGRIGINEKLLQSGQEAKLTATILHELIHAIFHFHDYNDDFIFSLLAVAKHLHEN